MMLMTRSILRLLPLLVAVHGVARAEEVKQPEVEVRGSRPPRTSARKDPSVAGSTIERDALEPPGLGAPDALRTQVGVTVTETGGLGAAATASVRGATAAQTPVYLAGVRINDDVGGAADLSTVPLFLIDRVEIYRGNAPLEADRLGIGGAIFFEPMRKTSGGFGIGGLAGSFGTRGAWGYAAAGGADGTNVLLGARADTARNDYVFKDDRGTLSDGSDDRERRLENADASLLDLWLLARKPIGGGRVDLVLNRFEREQGAPGLANVPTFAARQSQGRTLVSVAGRAPFARAAWLDARTTLLVARQTLFDPLLTPGRNPGELGLGSRRITTRGERVEEELGVRLPIARAHVLRITGSAASERLRRFEGEGPGSEEPAVAAQRITFRTAASAALALTPRASLRPLVLFECHDTGTTHGSGCDTFEPSGRLGGLVTLEPFSLFASVGRYARVPTLGELFGTSVLVRGQPTLRSEEGATIDAGARFVRPAVGEAAPLAVSLSGYVREATDLVTYVRTAQDYLVPVNLGEARVAGLELDASAGFARFFSAELAATLTDARDRTPGRTLVNDLLPYHSRLIVAPGLRARTPQLLPFALTRATLGTRLVYQSSRYGDPAGQAVIPEQASLDVDAALSGLGGAAILRARMSDVFDAARFDVVGFPLPGRSLFVSLELTQP
jgi:vitamin B12 transporter